MVDVIRKTINRAIGKGKPRVKFSLGDILHIATVPLT